MDRESDLFVERVAVRHGADLLRYLERRLRARMDAPDLAQEVYLRLLRLKDNSLVRDPQSYVFRVAANLLHETALRHPQHPGAEEQEAPEPATDAREPEQTVERRERALRLKLALDGLSPKCRTVFILHRRDDMTYEEIARHVGISMSMVKKYLGIAIRHCRQQLRDLEP